MKLQLPALALAAALAAPAAAQSLLDQQLGPTPAQEQPKPATDKAEEKPLKPAARPAPSTNDMISPDAARRVDDADLVNKLTKGEDAAKEKGKAAEQMKAMIERMGQSQTRLAQIDPGDVTQETQRRIITDLDFFIELARKQQQQGQSQSQQEQEKEQSRQYSQGNQQQPGQNQGGSNAAQGTFLPKGNQAQPQPGEDIRAHSPEEWGKLRPRERDLISHGANEEYLAPYRDMIERYYQALAELGSKTRK